MLFWKTSLTSKNCFGYFWETFGIYWATFWSTIWSHCSSSSFPSCPSSKHLSIQPSLKQNWKGFVGCNSSKPTAAVRGEEKTLQNMNKTSPSCYYDHHYCPIQRLGNDKAVPWKVTHVLDTVACCRQLKCLFFIIKCYVLDANMFNSDILNGIAYCSCHRQLEGLFLSHKML